MAYNLGVDVGGTFTDVIVIDQETGEITTDKVLTEPENIEEGVMEGVGEATRMAGVDLSDLEYVFHGTTVVTNMLLEETGADVGLITNEGFEHILHLARAWTPGPLYGWVNYEKPTPLADLEDTRGIGGRMGGEGDPVSPVDEDEIIESASELVDAGVEAIAVVLLNSYINSKHEEQVKEAINSAFPDLPVTTSSGLSSEYGEYERALTAVINSYVRPTVVDYINDLDTSLREGGMEGKLNIVRSDGGIMSADEAADMPVHIALSGPSGGCVGAAYLAEQMGVPNVLTLDMGGTSTDVSLVEDGQPTITRESEVGYRQFKSRTIDINTVGAGGGSIAHILSTGALNVGPQSAGTDPGPACYDFGGTKPTVTDANVVLGRIPSAVKLGGTLELNREKAREAVGRLADERGASIEETAQTVLDIVNHNMYSALRVVSVEKGYDPREFGLVAFGGAGPMHANALADLIEASPVIIPPGPGVMSALGFLTSDIQNEFVRPYRRLETEIEGIELHDEFKDLEEEAATWLTSEGMSEEDHAFEYTVDCRYMRQDIQMPVSIDIDTLRNGEGLELIHRGFEQQHEQQFGFTLDVAIEIANLRIVGRGVLEGVVLREEAVDEENPSDDAILGYEDVYFDGQVYDTPVFRRNELLPGNILDGPAIVIEDVSTTVVQPDNSARINEYGCIEITGMEDT